MSFDKEYRRDGHRICWGVVKDFLQDNNSTPNFQINLASEIPCPVGTCGLRPDEAAINSEPINTFDMIADKMGWDGRTRKIEYWLWKKVGRVSRIIWLEDQVKESLKTGTAPLASMTPQESSWFLNQLSLRKQKNKNNEGPKQHPGLEINHRILDALRPISGIWHTRAYGLTWKDKWGRFNFAVDIEVGPGMRRAVVKHGWNEVKNSELRMACKELGINLSRAKREEFARVPNYASTCIKTGKRFNPFNPNSAILNSK